MALARFYQGKRILVTGHTGFKGSWLCLWLSRLGATVTGISLPPPTRPSLFQTANVTKMIDRSLMIDICDQGKLKKAVKQLKPDIVFHMAAQSLVRLSYQMPVKTYMTNVMGTVNLLEAVRCVPSVRVVVNVTTDKCYENTECHRAFRENDPLGGHDPYSSSKACAEIVSAAYRRSFFQNGVKIATVRAGNVIGGGDWAKDRLIPDCVRSLLKGDAIILRNPHAVRPWQHVLDPLAGYLMLAQRLVTGGMEFAAAWNFGPKKCDVASVRQVVQMFAQSWGAVDQVKLSREKHPHEAGFLMLDARKAREGLGWGPRLSLEDALHQTAAWYQAWNRREDMRAYSLAQISDYMSKEPR